MKLSTQIIAFVLGVIFLAGCSTSNFNAKYENIRWQKVMVSPVQGALPDVVEAELDHTLSVSESIDVVSPSVVKILLEKHGLTDSFAKNPIQAMQALAKLEKAQGIVVVNTSSSTTNYGKTIHSNYASVHAKLLDAMTLQTVFSSLSEDSSTLATKKAIMKEVSYKVTSDLAVSVERLSN